MAYTQPSWIYQYASQYGPINKYYLHMLSLQTCYLPLNLFLYLGNGRFCHPTGEYKDWKASDWHDKFEMHNHITLSNGNISIRTKGLYFVYAQVYLLAIISLV